MQSLFKNQFQKLYMLYYASLIDKFLLTWLKGAMRCLQAKPYKYTCYSCQAAATSVLANRPFHVLGNMLHKILCGFLTGIAPLIKTQVD